MPSGLSQGEHAEQDDFAGSFPALGQVPPALRKAESRCRWMKTVNRFLWKKVHGMKKRDVRNMVEDFK